MNNAAAAAAARPAVQITDADVRAFTMLVSGYYADDPDADRAGWEHAIELAGEFLRTRVRADDDTVTALVEAAYDQHFAAAPCEYSAQY